MNGFLVDTNVISEILRASPDRHVAGWTQQVTRQSLFLSVIPMGELRKGLTIMPPGSRRTQLEKSIEEQVLAWFVGRILPVTQSIAERWGILDGERQLAGRPLNVPDGQVAATALEHELTVVARNAKDFAALGVGLLNPWESDLVLTCKDPRTGGTEVPRRLKRELQYSATRETWPFGRNTVAEFC
jgi:predicted nucleic acid-binding protein